MDTLSVLWDVDSYKTSHWRMYDPSVTHTISYLTARRVPGWAWDGVVPFGMLHYLRTTLAQRITEHDVWQAHDFYRSHIGFGVFNTEQWLELVHAYPSSLPIRIDAAPEGSLVREGDPILVVQNTDARFPWLTSWIETSIERLWYPTTVATFARAAKKVLRNAADRDGTPRDAVNFKLHDFGSRGTTTADASAIGGAAHLTSFHGSDNVPGVMLVRWLYDVDMPAQNIPAAEHSTITSWGGRDSEARAFGEALSQYEDAPLLSMVSDTYDYQNAVSKLWGQKLRDRVLSRPGTLVVRPDSGDVVDTVLWTLNELGRTFGYTTNARGFKELDPHVRIIQGDGMNLDTLQDTVDAMHVDGWAIENITFGMGGALLQKHNRDTLGFGYKLCGVMHADRSNAIIDVHKEPHDDASKRSRGYLEMYATGALRGLKTVYENGSVGYGTSFSSVRGLVEDSLGG